LRLRTWEEYARGERRPAYRHVQFASRYLMDAAREAAGGPHPGWRVIRWGVDTERFAPGPAEERRDLRQLRLLYVGQGMRHKGVHTAVEALRVLQKELSVSGATLDVVGDGSGAPRYVARLRRTIERAGLETTVRLCGPVERERLPQVYREHDLLIFPSVWNEPFSITVLEAMASGLPVVGTLTGGSPEVMQPERNALSFPPEDASACAAQIARVVAEPELYGRLGANARRTVVEGFGIGRMVDAVEDSLVAAARRANV
jgi:glycosyltransferase involved in cell wall biosynthesis